MNSLANLNSLVADEQADSTPWPSDHGWEPPVATICTGSLSDHTRLHFHHTAAAPQQAEWDWSDSQIILAPQFVPEDDDSDCKPGILHVDTLARSELGLRQYSTGLMSAAASMVAPSLVGSGGATPQTTSWPVLLNSGPLRQQIVLESSGGSCYSSSPLMYGGTLGAHVGSSNTGLAAGNYYNNRHQSQMLDMEQRRIHDSLKRGVFSTAEDLVNGRLGLNLGGRNYFSTEDVAARLLSGGGKRFRPNSPISMHVPFCQAEGCKANLGIANHYHRRHKVCEYHSKAPTVTISGNTQRFCQQCSRFHELTEFDEAKRSCRKRLADHNRRRRKPQPVAALPAADSATPATEAAISSNDTPASKQNEDNLQDSKPGTSLASRSLTDQQGGQQSKEGLPGNTTASSSSTEQQTLLLSPMTLAPSVSLTLQNGGGRTEMQSKTTMVGSQENTSETEAAYINSLAPCFLNGPSLSLSTNNAASGGVREGGGSVPASTNQHSPAHAATAPSSFDAQIELSVPWLRGHHVGSSSRVGFVQESLGKLSTYHQVDEHSMVYKSSSSTASRRNSNGQYFNEHGRILAEHIQSLQTQVQNPTVQDHHHSVKSENWMLEGAVAQERQTVLSLLETAAGNVSRKKDCNEYTNINAVNHQHHHYLEEAHKSAGARHHPLDFLQQQQHPHHGGLHLNSASPTDVDHEASDAAVSLHCMQVLRPLNESLYTTADFMKDSFV